MNRGIIYIFLTMMCLIGCSSPTLKDRLKWDAAKNWEISKMAVVPKAAQYDSCRVFLKFKYELKQIWNEINRAYPANRKSGNNILIIEFYKQPWSKEPTARLLVDDMNAAYVESDSDKHRYQCQGLYHLLSQMMNNRTRKMTLF